MIKAVKENNSLTLVAQEDFIFHHSKPLQEQMLKHLKNVSSGRVILDLTHINSMDSVGIKLVIGLFKTCQDKGLDFCVEVSSATILQLFHICKLNQILDVREVLKNG